MKILLVHNFYNSTIPSGENMVFKAEASLLRENGHHVIEYTRNSDEIVKRGLIGKIKGGLTTPWNPVTALHIKRILSLERPDIMHVHNFFPLISPSILYASGNTNTATVMTLHNYRLICAGGMLLKKGRACKLCFEKNSILPAIRFRCYRASAVATLPICLMIYMNTIVNTWKKVDAIITLSSFQKTIMTRHMFNENSVHIKPNFVPNHFAVVPWGEREDKIVFVGRLGEEKGTDSLVEAWKIWGDTAPRLEIIGDGPAKNLLVNAIDKSHLNNKIILRGQLARSEIAGVLSKAKLLLMPSICYETFGLSACEAFACAVPVVASRIGSFPDIVQDGVGGELFDCGNVHDLLNTVRSLWSNQNRLAEYAKNARRLFEEKYTTDVNYEILMDIYRKAIQRRLEKSPNINKK